MHNLGLMGSPATQAVKASAMTTRDLATYGMKNGSTAGIADMIAGYDAVVLGGAPERIGAWSRSIADALRAPASDSTLDSSQRGDSS